MDTETEARRAKTHVGQLAIWTLAWVLSLALARFGPGLWESQPVLSWIAVGINIAVGVGWLIAHARYLRGVDDLQRKILMDALAVALGVGLVGGLAYSVANSIGLIDVGASIGVVSVIMGVVYLVATGVGTLRYR
jgi:hypothetical protein